MKRIIALPLMILYLFAVSGAMVQIHFCQQEAQSWKVNQVNQSCCCGEGLSNLDHSTKIVKDDCCTDKTIVVKTISDQITASAFQFLFTGINATLLSKLDFTAYPHPVHLTAQNAFFANAPPGLWQDIPLFKLHKRFTYYG